MNAFSYCASCSTAANLVLGCVSVCIIVAFRRWDDEMTTGASTATDVLLPYASPHATYSVVAAPLVLPEACLVAATFNALRTAFRFVKACKSCRIKRAWRLSELTNYLANSLHSPPSRQAPFRSKLGLIFV